MSKHSNTPELRFPEFDGEWEEKKLGAEVTFYSGLTYKPDDINFEGTFVLRSSNIKNGKLVDADNVYVDSNKISCTFVNEGDVIVVVRNGSRNLIGKHARVNTKLSNTVIGAFMTGIRCYNSKFINSLLDTNNFYREIHRNLGATINQITTGNFKKMSFYFPDDKEKEKIGEFFGKLDRQIELEEEKLELLEQQKRGYMQKIFSQELRVKDVNGNHYPQWTLKNFKEVFQVVPSKKYQIKSSEVEDNANIPVVDQGQNLILGYSNNKEKIFKDFKNVIIYGDHTTFVKKLDKPFIIGGDGVKLLTSKTDNDINYLYNVLQYFNVKPEGYKRHFSILKTKYLYIATSIEEQKRIATLFNKIDKLIENQSKKLDFLKQRKQGLLQKMFI